MTYIVATIACREFPGGRVVSATTTTTTTATTAAAAAALERGLDGV